MITKKWLSEQIDTLSVLEIDARRRLKDAQGEFLSARVNLREAESAVNELKSVKEEIQWQLDNCHFTEPDGSPA